MKRFRLFSKEETDQFNEIEAAFNETIKRNKLKLKFLLIYAVFTIVSLFNDVNASLELNISIFKFIAITVLGVLSLVILNFLGSRVDLIKGNNIVIRILSDYNLLAIIVFIAAACNGLALGAAIRDMYFFGFQKIDCAYVIVSFISIMIVVYLYKLVIPVAVFPQDA